MYPIPAVLVNCIDTRSPDVRAVLANHAVTITDDFAAADDVQKKWPTPPSDRRMFVVHIQGLKAVANTAKLADGFPGWPILALVNGSPDAAGLYQVSRAGAAQILPYPFEHDDLQQALDRIVTQFGLRSAPARVIAVSSAAPGSGATVLAVNIAAEASRTFEIPTVLTELEFGVGRLAGYLNLTPAISNREILVATDPPLVSAVQDALTPAGPRLQVLSGPFRMVSPFQPAPGRVAHLIGVLRRLSPLTVVDLPATFDATYFEAATLADRVVLIGRQDVPTIQAMRLVRDSLNGRGLPDPMLVLNSFDSELEAFSPTKVGEVLRSPAPRTVRQDAASVRNAGDSGKPLLEIAPRSATRTDILRLTTDLLNDLGYHLSSPGPQRRSFLS